MCNPTLELLLPVVLMMVMENGDDDCPVSESD